jgi:hypothetical protein
MRHPEAAAPDIDVPENLPFLKSISWFDVKYRDLSPLDMLRRYESGWRWLGVSEDPTPEEWEFIRALVARFGSVLESDVRDWTRYLNQS